MKLSALTLFIIAQAIAAIIWGSHLDARVAFIERTSASINQLSKSSIQQATWLDNVAKLVDENDKRLDRIERRDR